MKILYSAEIFYPPISGAEKSVLTLFEKLKKENEIEVICTGDETKTVNYRGVSVHYIKTPYSHLRSWVKRYFLNKLWFNLLDSLLKKRSYDLVITQTELLPSSVIMAKRYHIPVISFIKDFQHFCLSILRDVKIPEKHNCLRNASWKYKIQYPFFKETIKWNKIALKKTDFAISLSKFVQKVAREYGVSSKVIYPFVKLKNYISKRRKTEYITLVRPCIRKGLEVFLKIADQLPEQKFLTVGRGEKIKEIRKRRNIKYIPWTNNMKSIYSKTKILLVPSIWFEPFGRVAVEAMCNGIPCIVSNKGGLQEIVNNAGIILDPFNVEKWINSIKNLEENRKLYKKLSKKSKKQVKKFGFKKQYNKFEKIIKSLS